tara:strand:+ start:7570 stop:8982 length:1413 start_codon:yes stop_codon:yes gene_type:complete
MAGAITGAAGQPALTPSSSKSTLPSNYITSFDFLTQYLPDTYEREFERYGNRSINAFLRMVGAEMPTNSDLIKWEEQGRLHTKFQGVTLGSYTGAETVQTLTFTANHNLRVGQTIIISDETAGSALSNKAIVTDAAPGGVLTAATVAYYEATQAAFVAASTMTVFVYGSEFAKGAQGMVGSLEADPVIFDNKPIIIKDKYIVAGSDMAQIGWVEVTSENGADGYLWYIKSEHETRLRFDDQLEMSMVEGVPAAAGSGVAAIAATTNLGNQGTDGMFHTIENRGNVWSGGNPTALADFDAIIQRLDKQGAIQENVLFVNRQMGFDIDDMLAAQNSYGAGGTSYGLFDNDEEMALNLGFSGFKRGYEFYKSDWKYLNDATLRGGLVGGAVNGVLVPAGSTNVYDQVMGKNARRPFLHVRYRASETEDRRYKTWITGSAGGAATSDLDAMEVNFLSERALCTLGANNFFIFKS